MNSNAPRPRLEARRSNERPHVLIVSDDVDLSEFLAEGLPLGGFWASVIASGLQALEVFRLRQFDLIVVDADMRSFDAMEFLRRLRGVSGLDRAHTSRTTAPAILIHGGSNDMASRTGTLNSLGVVATLGAPLELDDVVRTLHQAFEEWRSHHPDTPLADSASVRAF